MKKPTNLTLSRVNMDFKKLSINNFKDATKRIDLFDPSTEEIAEHEGKAMFITIKSDKSPEYEAEWNRQINARAKKVDDVDYSLSDRRLNNARLCAAVTVECKVFFGEWIEINEQSSQQNIDVAKKKLRAFYAEVPEMAKIIDKHMTKDANFLEQSAQN